MNLLKQNLNRAQQSLTEKFGSGEKTDLDPELARELLRIDDLKTYTKNLLTNVEAFVQPDTALRVLPGMVKEGINKSEAVAQEMGHLATKLGPEDQYGKILSKGSETFHRIGELDRNFLTKVQAKYIQPVKRFLNDDVKGLDDAKIILEDRRLDMDALKSKMAKGNPGGTVEQDLKKAKQAYDEQVEKVRGLTKSIEAKLIELQDHLKNFVEAQLEFHAHVQQALNELKKNL